MCKRNNQVCILFVDKLVCSEKCLRWYCWFVVVQLSVWIIEVLSQLVTEKEIHCFRLGNVFLMMCWTNWVNSSGCWTLEGKGLGSKAGGFNSVILADSAWTSQILELSCDISFIASLHIQCVWHLTGSALKDAQLHERLTIYTDCFCLWLSNVNGAHTWKEIKQAM